MTFPLMGAGIGGLAVEHSIEAMISALKEYEEREEIDVYIYVLNDEIAQRVLKKLVSLGFKQNNRY
ncbi:MAG: hypothetical protein QXL96_02685 [Ignisphaera sp.]